MATDTLGIRYSPDSTIKELSLLNTRSYRSRGRLTTKKDLSQVDSQADRESHLINDTP
jgi:hypothetical protein